ncbi:MAG: GTP 3',8-cyclase MoaA [Leptospiraceae bacterium]|nr:GTP 3',8-cyclase MoaA [Leptospiraceae bacterium]
MFSQSQLLDSFNRVHDYLRVSITGKCNFNCTYCNPQGEKSGVEHITSNEENLEIKNLHRLLSIFIERGGIRKIRITGGEPLLRNDLDQILSPLKEWKKKFPLTLALSTNGSLLEKNIPTLINNQIEFLNISIDSLNRRRFKEITGRDNLEKVLNGIEKAIIAGFKKIKLNAVYMQGINEIDCIELVDRFQDQVVDIRFIEYMPIGINDWKRTHFAPYIQLENSLRERFTLIPEENLESETSKNFTILGKNSRVSFISPMSEHFCDSCNRLRLTASGKLRLCLFSPLHDELDLAQLIEQGFTDEEIFLKIQKYLPTKWLKHPPMDELAKMKTAPMVSLGG